MNIYLLFLITVTMNLHAQWDFSELDRLIEHAIEERIFPGGVFLVYYQGKTIYHKAFGYYTYEQEDKVTTDTLYDIASLTKIIATTTLAMLMYDQKKLSLDASIHQYLDSFPHKNILIKHLLNHTSGIKESLVSYSEEQKKKLWDEMMNYPVDDDPGVKVRYTCTDMILLQKIIENILNKPFAEAVKLYVTEPLHMNATMFNPEDTYLCAPTRSQTARGTIQGTVNDDRAYMLGGRCGNAGLFSTARDLKKFIRMILCDGKIKENQFIQSSTINTWLSNQLEENTITTDRWGYGWMIGRHLSSDSVGHYGWTGTSLWADRKRHMCCIALTNRTYPDDSDFRIRPWRIAFHNLVSKLLL